MKKINKKVYLVIAFIVTLVLLFSLIWLKSDMEYKKDRAKCPDYGYPYENDGWAFGPGTSDDPEFIDCGGNLVIERRRNIFVPNANYPYVVENYRQEPNGSWPDVLVYLDNSKRFKFIDDKLYAFSTFEGKPTYYILNIGTAKIENKFQDINQLSESEKSIFNKLSQ